MVYITPCDWPPLPLPTLSTALPAYSVTRAFCKHLLRDTFTSLLLPGDAPSGSRDPTAGDTCLETLKSILDIAKEADSTLLNCYGSTKQLMMAAIDSGVWVVECCHDNHAGGQDFVYHDGAE